MIIRRISTSPDSPLRVSVDIPDAEGNGGFHSGGVYYFQPAGHQVDGKPTGEDQYQVTEEAARAIMSDPELRKHFTCEPPLKDAQPADAPGPAEANPGGTDFTGPAIPDAAQVDDAAVDGAAAAQPDGASGGKASRKKPARG
jgi:hypothetical protein